MIRGAERITIPPRCGTSGVFRCATRGHCGARASALRRRAVRWRWRRGGGGGAAARAARAARGPAQVAARAAGTRGGGGRRGGDGGLCGVAAAVRAHVAELRGLDMPAEEVRLLLLATPPLGADYGGLALQAAYGVAMGAGRAMYQHSPAPRRRGVGSRSAESMLAQLVRDRRGH